MAERPVVDVFGDFHKDRFALAKGLVTPELCAVSTRYALFRRDHFPRLERAEVDQVPGTHAAYGDTLMESLMAFLLPHLQRITGLELCPTYSYYRVYKPGDALARHSDRQACEISASLCLGRQYDGVAPDYHWGIRLDPRSQHWEKLHRTGGQFVSDGRPGVLVKQLPGDCLVYRGCELEHWRDPFRAAESSYQVQAFLHYIDMNGPFFPEWVYDKRRAIGAL